MKYFALIAFTSVLLTSCSHDRNNTDTGEFWYKEFTNPTVGHQLLHNRIDTYKINGHYYIHLITHLSIDQNEYYFGTSTIHNDTLSFDFKEKDKFSFSRLFSKTQEMSPKLVLYNLYFSSDKIPKTVCWGKTPIDSISH